MLYLVAAIPPDIEGISGWVPLARGGFATVWKARRIPWTGSSRSRSTTGCWTMPAERRRFLGEAEAAGALSGHPGIVTVHNAGILPDGRPYLVMELCPGGSLTSWLDPAHRPSQERVRDVGVRIADALATAHAHGMLHRDVKPANILIDRYGNPGLADFGLTALPEPDASPRERYAAMTPAYAPLEVLRLQRPSESGDIYQLAATLYALLSGHAASAVGQDHARAAGAGRAPPEAGRAAARGECRSDGRHARRNVARGRGQAHGGSLPGSARGHRLGAQASSRRAEGAAVGASRLKSSIHDGPGTDGSSTTDPKPRRRRRLALGIVLVGVIGVLAIVLAGSGVYLYQIDQSVNANINRGIDLPPEWGSPTAEARPIKNPEVPEALNYVLIGSDEGDPASVRDGPAAHRS